MGIFVWFPYESISPRDCNLVNTLDIVDSYLIEEGFYRGAEFFCGGCRPDRPAPHCLSCFSLPAPGRHEYLLTGIEPGEPGPTATFGPSTHCRFQRGIRQTWELRAEIQSEGNHKELALTVASVPSLARHESPLPNEMNSIHFPTR